MMDIHLSNNIFRILASLVYTNIFRSPSMGNLIILEIRGATLGLYK